MRSLIYLWVQLFEIDLGIFPWRIVRVKIRSIYSRSRI